MCAPRSGQDGLVPYAQRSAGLIPSGSYAVGGVMNGLAGHSGSPSMLPSSSVGLPQVVVSPLPSDGEAAAFGGIPGPSSVGRSSARIQAQPNADDLQMARAMRAAKLHDAETSSGLNFNKKYSVLSF